MRASSRRGGGLSTLNFQPSTSSRRHSPPFAAWNAGRRGYVAGGWQMIARGFGCGRKVRTPSGNMPCRMRGRVGPKSGATESVTENKPPGGPQGPAGKGEKAGQEPTAPGAIPGARKTPCGARQNRKCGPPVPAWREPGSFRVLVALCVSRAFRFGGAREMIIDAAGDRGGTEFGLKPPTYEGALWKRRAPSLCPDIESCELIVESPPRFRFFARSALGSAQPSTLNSAFELLDGETGTHGLLVGRL